MVIWLIKLNPKKAQTTLKEHNTSWTTTDSKNNNGRYKQSRIDSKNNAQTNFWPSKPLTWKLSASDNPAPQDNLTLNNLEILTI